MDCAACKANTEPQQTARAVTNWRVLPIGIGADEADANWIACGIFFCTNSLPLFAPHPLVRSAICTRVVAQCEFGQPPEPARAHTRRPVARSPGERRVSVCLRVVPPRRSGVVRLVAHRRNRARPSHAQTTREREREDQVQPPIDARLTRTRAHSSCLCPGRSPSPRS